MTFQGVVQKTVLLFIPFSCSLALSWIEVVSFPHGMRRGSLLFLLIVAICIPAGLALVWFPQAKKEWSPVTAPIYALLQGVVVGFLSAAVDRRYPGTAIQAVCLTIIICVCLLSAYRFGWIRVTDSFNKKLMLATSGVILYYALTFFLIVLHVPTPAMLTGWIPSILTSAVIVMIAGMSLISDCDSAVQASKENFPQYMEWYAALGLMITLVWLYIETLNLLEKLKAADER
jgi:uncharacterized YccA/Bax inhibitor family protein